MLKICVYINRSSENEGSKRQEKHSCDCHYFSSRIRGSAVGRSPQEPLLLHTPYPTDRKTGPDGSDVLRPPTK